MLLSSYCSVWYVVVLLQRLVCYCLIEAFSLLPSYCDIWFVVILLQLLVCCCPIVVFNLCGGDSVRHNEFGQSKILNYDHQYVEELEL